MPEETKSKSLVIVESPAKAKTMSLYLGSAYLVKASMGHVRDLPRTGLGVDIDRDFQPQYKVIPERKKTVHDLQNAARTCRSVILAADPDREGEAISWHLSTLLEKDNPNIFRVIFHEITRKAVEEAFRTPGQLDRNKIDAQQTRRILDRLVGYLISPLLWKKIGKGLSAGRVQSIALRLICEREREIRDFVQEEFWTITAHLRASNPPPFKAVLIKIDGKAVKIKDGGRAGEIVEGLKKEQFILHGIKVREKKRNSAPPYITSTLQQDGFRILRFPVKKTMAVAQKLYEGLPVGDRGPVGLITYMRTDSVRTSNEALAAVRKCIEKMYSRKYLPPQSRLFKNKRKAQDAHEAIRPTSFDLPPEAVKPFLKKEEHSLYTLIWNRFLASQMSPAVIEETEFDIRASRYQFKAKGEVVKFDGFLAVFSRQKDEASPDSSAGKEEKLPKAGEGEELTLFEVEPQQNFTQPPPRFTEGSLVRELEAKSIGRPSTYAPIIATLQDRVYVIKDKGKFIPTDLGLFVTDFMVKNFPDLMEVKFTARMEEELDRISEGGQDWLESLRNYYALLERDLKKGMETEGVKGKGIPVGETCPECGRQLVIKEGRFGRFKACSGYPECNHRESLIKKEPPLPLEEKCPMCGSPLVLRHGRYGAFVACSKYPECKFIKKDKLETGIACPLGCGGMIVSRKTKKGKMFFGCNRFPACRFATWDEPIRRPCPKCGREFLLRKSLLKGSPYLYCWDEKCGYKSEGPDQTS